RLANSDTTFKEAFEMADEVLQQGVRGITDLMVMPGLINLDFADVRSVMGEMGKAMMGTGEASGENRAIEAAEKAISNPLLDGVSLKGAKGVIISITGGEDMKLMEVDEAASHIKELVDPDANIIWGSAFNNGLEGKIRVSVVATGIESEAGTMAQPAKVFSFPGRTAPANLSVAPMPTVTQTIAPTMTDTTSAADEDMLELTSDDEAGELVLDGDDVLTTPVGSVPVGPPADDDLTATTAGDRTAPTATEDKPKIATGGGTLFERMSNIARGAAQAEGNDGEAAPSFRREPLDIPRFLNRQNNQ
ncbi:MAG: cell division protein FtsZ, partial [Pseudomonadota bacterium]